MLKVGILGATGYTALELIKILLRHPQVEISALTSRQEGNPHVTTVHPQLAGRIDLRLEALDAVALAGRTDFVFSCLPHGASAAVVEPLLGAGSRVVDFSADFRLTDPELYSTWYGQKHPSPERLGPTAYGLPELFRESISGAHLIANPGCYPTTSTLALAPLLKRGLIEPKGIVIDAKSGVSGAGREPRLTTHYPECNESISAYNVGRHRHTPEIDQVLYRATGVEVKVIFTPHLVPMDRGILATTYSQPRANVTEESLLDCLREYYADEPFVCVVDHLPATKDTANSNFCHITARLVRDRVLTISCLDNLIKGASGAAVQNMNLMVGYEETLGNF